MRKSLSIQKLATVLGCVLIVISLILLALWQFSVSAADKKSSDYVETIRGLVGETVSAVPEKKSNNDMPMLSLDGTDFIALIEFPKNGSVLPIRADWDTKLMHPSRYTGSVYDGSLKIGATTQSGQFDFYREISAGDVIYFTDMTGNRYTYEVSDISYRKHADNETLNEGESELTLFIKNIYAFEYIIIYCENPS